MGTGGQTQQFSLISSRNNLGQTLQQPPEQSRARQAGTSPSSSPRLKERAQNPSLLPKSQRSISHPGRAAHLCISPGWVLHGRGRDGSCSSTELLPALPAPSRQALISPCFVRGFCNPESDHLPSTQPAKPSQACTKPGERQQPLDPCEESRGEAAAAGASLERVGCAGSGDNPKHQPKAALLARIQPQLPACAHSWWHHFFFSVFPCPPAPQPRFSPSPRRAGRAQRAAHIARGSWQGSEATGSQRHRCSESITAPGTAGEAGQRKRGHL